jgi:hypothetical protein
MSKPPYKIDRLNILTAELLKYKTFTTLQNFSSTKDCGQSNCKNLISLLSTNISAKASLAPMKKRRAKILAFKKRPERWRPSLKKVLYNTHCEIIFDGICLQNIKVSKMMKKKLRDCLCSIFSR